MAGPNDRWLDVRCIPILNDDGEISLLVEWIRDVTAQRQAENNAVRFRIAMDNSAGQVFLIDRKAMRFVDVNENACRELQFTKAELLEMGPQDIKPHYSRKTLRAEFDRIIRREGASGVIETVHQAKDGRHIPVEVRFSSFGETGREMIIASARDITRSKRLEAELKRLASVDDLTGLWNRRDFMQAAQNEMERAKRYGRVFSYITLDIDHFKRINDTYGHAAGDMALQRLAKTIQAGTRSTDIAGRMGGEEFGILLPDTGLERAGQLAERLRAGIEETAMPCEGNTIFLTASFGVSAYENGPEGLPGLMARADQALYEAKAGGRNRIRVA